MNTKPNLKAIIDNNLDKTGHIPSKGQSTLPKGGWLDSYKSRGQPCYNCGGMYKQGGSYASSWMLTNPKPAPVSFPRMDDGGEEKYKRSISDNTRVAPRQVRGEADAELMDYFLKYKKPYEPSQSVKNIKAGLSAADLATIPFTGNPIGFAVNRGLGALNSLADASTSLLYAKDGQWKNAGIDFGEALLDLIPFRKGKRAINLSKTKPGFIVNNLSNTDKAINTLLKIGKGASYVDDFQDVFPRKENGGDISIPDLDADKWLMKYDGGGNEPPSSRADSIMLMKNSIDKINFYKNNPNYIKSSIPGLNLKDVNVLKNLAADAVRQKEIFDAKQDSEDYIPYRTATQFNLTAKDVKRRTGKVSGSKNVYSAPDIITPTYIDTYFNPSAPPVLFSPSIAPQGTVEYISTRKSGYGDVAASPYYDPLAVKPYNMRTPAEKIEWEKRYGKSNKQTITRLKSTPKPVIKENARPIEKGEIVPISLNTPSYGQPQMLRGPQPLNIQEPESLYRVQYYDPETHKYTHKLFKDDKQGSEFMRSLPSGQGGFGTGVEGGWKKTKDLKSEYKQYKNGIPTTYEQGGEWLSKFADGGEKKPTPKIKDNLNIIPRATSADSLALYNNSIQLEKHYSNKNKYKNLYINDFKPKEGEIENENENARNGMLSYINIKHHPVTNRPTSLIDKTKNFFKSAKDQIQSGDYNFKFDEYYKKLNDNQYLQREIANNILDLESPMGLYDKRIEPSRHYMTHSINDKDFDNHTNVVDFYGYDPIMVKPYNMLTPKEKLIRDEKYPNKKPDSYKPKSKENLIPISKPIHKPIIKEDVRPIERGEIQTVPLNIPSIGKRQMSGNIQSLNIPAPEQNYKVQYYDPQTKRMTHRMFADEQAGSAFRTSLGFPENQYGVEGGWQKKYGGWLDKFADGGEDAPLPAIGSKAYYDLQKANQNRTDAIPSRGNQKEQAILQNIGQSKLAAQEAARVAANREGLSQYNPKPGDAEHRRIMAQKYAAEHGGYSDEQGNYHQGLLGDAADSRIANRTWENIIEPGINAEMVMSGAGLLGKGAKSLGKYASENIAKSIESKVLSNMPDITAIKNYPKELRLASKEAGKFTLPKYKDIYRMEPTSWTKDKLDPLSGRWFTDKPAELNFYLNNLKDENPLVNARLLKERVPERIWKERFGENMPLEAKQKSIGTGNFATMDDVIDSKTVSSEAARDLYNGFNNEFTWNEVQKSPSLFNPNEGIISDYDAYRLRGLKSNKPLSPYTKIEASREQMPNVLNNIFKQHFEKTKFGIPKKYVPFEKGGQWLNKYQVGRQDAPVISEAVTIAFSQPQQKKYGGSWLDQYK